METTATVRERSMNEAGGVSPTDQDPQAQTRLLLLRVKASVTRDRRLAFQLLEEAQVLQKLSLDLRRQQAEQAQPQAPTEPTP